MLFSPCHLLRHCSLSFHEHNASDWLLPKSNYNPEISNRNQILNQIHSITSHFPFQMWKMFKDRRLWGRGLCRLPKWGIPASVWVDMGLEKDFFVLASFQRGRAVEPDYPQTTHREIPKCEMCQPDRLARDGLVCACRLDRNTHPLGKHILSHDVVQEGQIHSLILSGTQQHQ